jgi:membrane associated rhomboid family serine protease
MNRSISKDINEMFSTTHMVNRLIIIAISFSVFYLLLNSFGIGLEGGFSAHDYLLLSSDLMANLKKPWVLLTHIFIAGSLIEMIWWLLLYYWFGSILGDLLGDDKILPVFLISCLTAAIGFMVLSFVFETGQIFLPGLKSAVVGTMVSSVVLVPDYSIRLVLIGKIRIKFIVIAVLLIDLLFLISSGNFSYLAYPGAVLAGWYYIVSIRAGKGLHLPVNRVLNAIFSFFIQILRPDRRKLNVRHRSDKKSGSVIINTSVDQKELNRILDKIRASGYDSLSEDEKQFLFKMSDGE